MENSLQYFLPTNFYSLFCKKYLGVMEFTETPLILDLSDKHN